MESGVLWGADLFMRRKSQAEKDEFIEAVKSGWVGLNGMYANELTGLCRPEELLQLFRYGTALGRQCGVPVNSAMISDVPGYTWGTIAAMAQAGIRYFSSAPNFFDRIGRIMVEWQDKPFWAISPSGKEKGSGLDSMDGLRPFARGEAMSAELVAKYQDRLDAVKFPYEHLLHTLVRSRRQRGARSRDLRVYQGHGTMSTSGRSFRSLQPAMHFRHLKSGTALSYRNSKAT